MILKRTAEYMMRNSRITIPSTLMETIDTTLWFVDVTKESTTTHATTAVARAIGTLSEEGKFDYGLLEAFQEIFEGWNKAMFDKLTMEGKRILKQFLREGGVYTGRKNGGIAAQLAELLTIENLPEWNMEEFKRMTFDERSKAFQKQQQQSANHPSPVPQHDQPFSTVTTRQERGQPPSVQLLQGNTTTPDHPWPQTTYRMTSVQPFPELSETAKPPATSRPYNPYQDLQSERRPNFTSKDWLCTTMSNTCREVAELQDVLVKTTVTGEQPCADLRSSIETSLDSQPFVTHLLMEEGQLYLNRGYNRSESRRGALTGPRVTRRGLRGDFSKYSTNSNSAEFKCEAKIIGIACKPPTLSCFERRPLRRKKRKRSRWPSFGPSRRPRFLQRFPRSSTAAPDRAQQYLEQSVRGTYIASICQPEAAFDLSIAAQAQNPKKEDYTKSNIRLERQMKNLQRDIRFVLVDPSTTKLMIVNHGHFADNQDLSSQLGCILTLVNEMSVNNTFNIYGDLIYWSSVNCKQVTRSTIASDIYAMVSGLGLGIAIKAILRMVIDRLNIPSIPLVICTNSYSLYECLVKLGTTSEKRLMIDIMALRQSYERREISEIRWINGKDNPADAMTKAKPNHALQEFIDSNRLRVRVEGFVDRPM